MDYPFQKLFSALDEAGIAYDADAEKRLRLYADLLIEWNGRMNLTAITDPEGIVIKHFLDSALLLKHIPLDTGASVIDVGTGAGFPGMVLLILRPDIKLTLLDGLNKRLVFLNEVIKQTGLTARTVHMRAEEAGKNPTYREQYDLVTARAVARLNVLSEYCLPFCKKGGVFCAMKGPSAAEEADEAKTAISLLGGENPSLFAETLTGNEQRTFVMIKKISQTPPKYPRISAKIAKQPL